MPASAPAPASDRLYFRSSGSNSASESIVLLHGGGAGSWMWEDVLAQMQDFHCLAPDLPEHGGSRAVGPFSMALAAEKVAELIREQARGGKAHLVGLSEGAQVAVQVLASAPELVKSAMISSALLVPIPGTGWAASPRMLSWAYKMSIPPFRSADWWIRMNMRYAAGIPEQYYAQFKQTFQETSESQFVNLMLANQRFRLPAGLEKAAAPTLVVVGAKEYPAMKQSARMLAEVLPHAKAVQISLGPKSSLAAEHNWALSAPDRFARTLRAWVTGTPLPDGLEKL